MDVHFDGPDFIVVDKPIGFTVQGDAKSSCMPLIQSQTGFEGLKVVHRLDRVTSGALILAKHSEAANELGQLFAHGEIEKTYWALAGSKPKKKQGWVKGGMTPARDGKWKLSRGDSGAFAKTYFSSASHSPKIRKYTLKPATGRTHQLRVAMKSLSVPILGDPLYQSKLESGLYDRCYLHCYQLVFQWKGQIITISIDPKSGTLWGEDSPH